MDGFLQRPGKVGPLFRDGAKTKLKPKFEDEVRPSRNQALKTKFGTEDEIRPLKPKLGPEA